MSRHGKFVDLDVDGLHLVFHLSRAGWLRWSEQLPQKPVGPGRSPLALRVHLDDGSGFDLTEQGTQKRLAVYVVHDSMDVPGIARLGPDPFDPAFDEETFGAILDAHARTQLKGLLREQSVIAGVGNAYSDEVLHVAKLSPFKLAGSLDPEERSRLFAALRETLADAVAAGERASRRRAQGRQAGGDARARAHRPAVPRVRRHRAGGQLRRLLAPVLSDVSDRRQAARRPQAVPPHPLEVLVSELGHLRRRRRYLAKTGRLDPRLVRRSMHELFVPADGEVVRPQVVAHRGASADVAEHTLLAYEQALQMGADALECDVRLTADGHLVCVHDRRIDRTTDARGPVSAMELSQLDELDFASWREGPPVDSEEVETAVARRRVLTLDRLLGLVADSSRRVELAIETKHPTRYAGLVERRLVETLARYGWAHPGWESTARCAS